VIVAKVNTAPLGVRTFEIIFVPFFKVGRVTDKFLVLFTVSDAFFAGAVYVVRFALEVVVVKKLLALRVGSLDDALGEGEMPAEGELDGRGDGERDG
jgi:hypothetical protein